MREVRRVLAPGGALLASSFAAGPEHPVKAAVAGAARAMGWRPPSWYTRLKVELADQVADPEAVAAMAERAGFVDIAAEARTLEIGSLDVESLIEYRLGMGSLAAFVGDLDPVARRRPVDDTARRLGADPEPLRPAVMLLSARVPAAPRPPA